MNVISNSNSFIQTEQPPSYESLCPKVFPSAPYATELSTRDREIGDLCDRVKLLQDRYTITGPVLRTSLFCVAIFVAFAISGAVFLSAGILTGVNPELIVAGGLLLCLGVTAGGYGLHNALNFISNEQDECLRNIRSLKEKITSSL